MLRPSLGKLPRPPHRSAVSPAHWLPIGVTEDGIVRVAGLLKSWVSCCEVYMQERRRASIRFLWLLVAPVVELPMP